MQNSANLETNLQMAGISRKDSLMTLSQNSSSHDHFDLPKNVGHVHYYYYGDYMFGLIFIDDSLK